MTSITVSTVWINLAADPSDYRSFPLMSALKVTPSVPGEARLLANGRIRVIKRVAALTQIDLSLRDLLAADVAWLTERTSELVCVRDDRGRKTFAVYFSVPIDEQQGDIVTKRADVNLTLSAVTHEEAV